MKKTSNTNSPVKNILRCISKLRILKILIPVSLLIIGLSSFYNLKAKRMFDQTNQYYIRGHLDLGFQSLQNSMFTVVRHYLLLQTASYFIGFCSLKIFKAFLTESLSYTISLEYTKFHTKGCGYMQDSITRTSKATRDLFPIVFFEVAWSLIDIFLVARDLYNLLFLEYFLKLMGFVIFSTILASLTALYAYTADRNIIHLFSKSLGYLSDMLNNFDVIKAFNKESAEIKQYNLSLKSFELASFNYYFFVNIFKFLQKSSLLLPNIFIYYHISKGRIVWKNEKDTISTITLYNSLFTSLKKDISVLRDHIFHYIKYVSQIDTEPKLFDIKTIEDTKLDKKTFDVSIKLDNVDFYAGNNIIQKNQSFEIKKNTKVAIVGTNGSGKSVFMKTLLKFFKNEGNFYIDGKLIQNISEKSIRNLIAYVPQDPHIFNNTVLYNLAYSQETINEDQIYEICQDFGLHEFFKSLRDGYYTMAGERGKYLSGGQKQRISFMRSIIKKAPILIMDEPTANIDKRSELEMVEMVLKKCPERTFILIVHNPELLSKFDQIINFEKTGISCYDSYEAYKRSN